MERAEFRSRSSGRVESARAAKAGTLDPVEAPFSEGKQGVCLWSRVGEEFKQAVAKHAPSVPVVERPLEYAGRLFGGSGWFWYEGRSQRLMASEPGSHHNLRLLPEDEEPTRCFLLWCERTLGAMAYLGWDTVWRLSDGWLVLMEEVNRATTFDELHAAGEKFGNVMGGKATRAFVMLAMVATLPRLPGAGQAHTMWPPAVAGSVSSRRLAACLGDTVMRNGASHWSRYPE